MYQLVLEVQGALFVTSVRPTLIQKGRATLCFLRASLIALPFGYNALLKTREDIHRLSDVIRKTLSTKS